MFFDSHTHLNYEEYSEAERQAIIKAIENSKVDYVLDAGTDLESSLLTVSHAEKLAFCYGAVGFHPHNAEGVGDEEILAIKNLARRKDIKAIGEIGLDFFYDYSERDVQRDVFRKQIRLANELEMPIVIHSREADQECMDILKEEGAFSKERKSRFGKREIPCEGSDEWAAAEDDARVLLHCFSGSRELGEQYVRLGATLSFAGPVTYKNNKKTVAVAEAIPLEFMLIETDAPFLTPVPLRGKKNISPYVEYTARKIAEIKQISLEEVAEKTMLNAKRFFGVV